jgi:DNA-binding transcriptional MerR regulator/predicted enzyme related to lactoylglutathione lyase
MAKTHFRVGELARLTGVSVRALHHYDANGLLCPSERGENAYRLYNASDIAQLQAISSLRSLGFSLAEIAQCLERHVFAPAHILELHITRVQERMAQETRLLARLQSVQFALQSKRDVAVDELLELIEDTKMIEKYYSSEPRDFLQQRAETIGQERIESVQNEWPILIDQVREALERGDDPASESSRELARRWNGLIEEFTGGNPAIRQSLTTMYREESNVCGVDVSAMQPLYEFIQRASKAEGAKAVSPVSSASKTMTVSASTVSLTVENVAASSAFLQQHFGFQEQMAADGFASLGREDVGMRVIFLQRGIEVLPENLRDQRAQGVILAFTVSDLAHQETRLRDEGVEITLPWREEPWGEKLFQVTDPNGVVIQLVEWAASGANWS